MQQIPIAEATDQLQELAEAAINGETVVIVIDGTHAVQLTPTRTRRAQGWQRARPDRLRRRF